VHIATRHVVSEEVDELSLVFRLQKIGQHTLRKSGERLVGGGEDRERAFRGERLHEVGSLERSDEGGELRCGNSEVDDGLAHRLRGVARHEHSVNDVNNTIGGLDISSSDLGAVDQDGVALSPNCHILPLHSWEHLHVHEVLSVHIATRHVVSEEVDELSLVFRLQKIGQHTLRKSGERLVGGGEDRERAFRGERLHEVGSLERSDEGGELRCGNSEVDDGLHLAHEHPATD